MTNIEINSETKNKLKTIGKILSPQLDIYYDDFDEIIGILINNFNNHKLKAEYDEKENIIKIGYENFTKINKIIEIAIVNNQVSHCGEAPKFLSKYMDIYEGELNNKKVEIFKSY